MGEEVKAEEYRRIYLGIAVGFFVGAIVLLTPVLLSLGVAGIATILVAALVLGVGLLLLFQMNIVSAPTGIKILAFITVFGVGWLMFQLWFGR